MVFDRKKYKEFARIQLNNRRGTPALITLITLVVIFLVNLPIELRAYNTYQALFQDILEDPEYLTTLDFKGLMEYYTSFAQPASLLLTYGLTILEAFIGVIFSFAAYNFYLAMSRSPEPVKFGTFIEGFNNWGRAVLALLWKTLWLFIWGLLCIPLYLAVVLVIAIAVTACQAVVEVMAIVILILVIPGTLIILMPVINKIVTYSMMYLICAEFKNISVTKAMKVSQKICKGHWWDIVGVWFSFWGWFILNAFTRNLLSLYVTPYYTMTKINVYHALLKEALEKGYVTPEELGQTAFQTEDAPVEQAIENTTRLLEESTAETAVEENTDETLREFYSDSEATDKESSEND